MDDGPTTKQKILIVAIWIAAAIFGFLTCFPEKMIGTPITTTTEVPTIPSILTTDYNYQWKLIKSTTTTTTSRPLLRSDKIQPHNCSVRSGVNDMLDYLALVVALVAPFLIGPCIVGIFQVNNYNMVVQAQGKKPENEKEGKNTIILVLHTLFGTYSDPNLYSTSHKQQFGVAK